MTENELKEKLVDAIYTIVKRVPDFCPDYNQIAKNGADVIMDIMKEYNNDMTQEEIEIVSNNCPHWNECAYPCKNCPTFKKIFKS